MTNMASFSQTLVSLLRDRASHSPSQRAFTFLKDGETEALSWTDQDLHHKACQIAIALQDFQGERALILHPPGFNYLSALFGCWYAGVIAVPAYPPRNQRNAERIQNIAIDAEVAVVLTTESHLENTREGLSSESHSEACKPRHWLGKVLDVATLYWLTPQETDQNNPQNWQFRDITPETLALLQYTSGSTGNPKGVMLTHGNLWANSAMIAEGIQSSPDDVAVTWLPPYHDMGLIGSILQPFYIGCPCIWMSPLSFLQQPYRWLKAISDYRGTLSVAPNFAYELCVDKITPEQRKSLDLSSWRIALTGAEPISPHTLDRFTETFAECGFKGESFYPCYGLAEATLLVTGSECQAKPVTKYFSQTELKRDRAIATTNPEDTQTFVSCGKPPQQQEIVIVNPDTLNPVPPCDVGEIWVRGESVAQGYWGKEIETQETFYASLQDQPEKSFLRTGDLGTYQNGELYVTGRRKDLIIIRGENYYPQDIEKTVENAHVALKKGCGAAFSIKPSLPRGGWGDKLVIVQEVERHYRRQPLDSAIRSIREAISQTHNLQVSHILLIKPTTIPKTSSGKIQRRACREKFLEGTLAVLKEWHLDTTESHPSPETITDIQSWLVAKLAENLSCSPQDIDIHAEFASYGLDSVAMVSLSGELENWLGRRLDPTLAYSYPTIASLSNYLTQHHATPETPQSVKTEAVAIIGESCRFPHAESPEEFWALLSNGRDAIEETSRTTIKTQGGFLKDIASFDAEFFGITPREAQEMDPQQRLLLEVTWEALERSGIAPSSLAGSKTGVFIGISSNDYFQLPSNIDAYTATGNAHSIAANRLSYFLDLQGPSLAVDTACSSSLVAVHLACRSLQQGDCDLAIVGGVNVILTDSLNGGLTAGNMLAADGRCKTFAASADGYGRGEGCGVVILKRVRDLDQDAYGSVSDLHALAVIQGSAINQDGRSNGLTAPNARSQQAVIQQALANAEATPDQIGYIETHGTGTPLGDPIEVSAIQAVLASSEREIPCLISSVKTNIGHLEAAAGIAGLIKASQCFQHQEIPPHLHLEELNPYLQLDQNLIDIPTTSQAWSPNQPLMGVSSFGFGGTNAHLIVAPPPPSLQPKTEIERSRHLFSLSAKSEPALQTLIQRYQNFLQSHSPSLADLCFTANTGRSHFSHRLAVTAETLEELQEKLDQASIQSIDRNTSPKIALLFTGQGSQYPKMGQQLYETQPLFREILHRCNQALPISLIKILYAEDTSLIDQTEYTQPILFAFEYALAQLWQSWGIKPNIVCGHSIGEYVAACLAGAFSLEDGLKLVTARGKLMASITTEGEMHAVFSEETTVRNAIADQSEVSIAVINTPQQVVISGEKTAISSVLNQLHGEGIETKPLNVSQAFHSPLMDSIVEEFRSVATKINYSPLTLPLASNVTGTVQEIGTVLDADYWCRHLRETVQFSQGIKSLERWGVDIFLEVGSHPILLGLAKQNLEQDIGIYLASLHRKRDNWEQLLDSLAQLYLAGISVNWDSFDAPYSRQKVILPTYPFAKTPYWLEKPTSTFKFPLKQFQFQLEINPQDFGEVSELPMSVYSAIAQQAGNLFFQNQAFDVQDLEIKTPLIFNNLNPKTVQVTVTPEMEKIANWELSSQGDNEKLIHASGRLIALTESRQTESPLTSLSKESPLTPLRKGGSWLDDQNTITSPQVIEKTLGSAIAELKHINQLDRYQIIFDQLEALSVDYILKTLQNLGKELEVNETFSTQELRQELGIIEAQQQLFRRLLDILKEANILTSTDEEWRVVKTPSNANPDLKIKELLNSYPEAKTELTLLQNCAINLGDVLQGNCDPLQLIFPDGDLTLATQLYQDSPPAKVMNQLLEKVISVASSNFPNDKTLNCLEIGAGTGGSTAYLLPTLNQRSLQYTFTDVSPLFLIKAQKKFRDYNFICYEKLDIEKEITAQNFPLHHYEIIIAANVLHATENLSVTLQNIKQLLAPNGLLILLEGTKPTRWLDLIFGLTSGWWRFNDAWRDNYPLLSATQWQTLLENSGFTEVSVLAPTDEQAILISQNETFETQSPTTPDNRKQQQWQIDQEEARAFLQEYQKAEERDRAFLLETYIRDKIARILRLPSPETINTHQSFFELGMDSLTAGELANDLEEHLGISLASTLALEYPTVKALVGELESKLSTKENQATTESLSFSGENNTSEEALETLSEEQLDTLLKEVMTEEGDDLSFNQ
ncbi:MAG: beta-ketoacyl synthase N-terminal-like domain-containing protein [Halothece sp.]